MLSATWLLQGSSALQVSPWVSLAACEFLSLPASGNLVDIEQMYRKGKRMQGRQRVFLMLLFMACLFLLPLLLLHLSDTSFGACGFSFPVSYYFCYKLDLSSEELPVAVGFVPGSHYLSAVVASVYVVSLS